MKKIIGFDIDGVLTDGDGTCWEEELITYFNLKPIAKTNNDSMRDRYGITEEMMNDFFTHRSHYVFPKLIMRSGADKLLQELKNTGFTVILITARTISPETPKWLKKHQIPFDLLIHEQDKLQPCIDNQVEIFIEDTVSNARAVSTVIPVLLMNTSYNQHEDICEQIYRVDGFDDIREFLYQYYTEKSA